MRNTARVTLTILFLLSVAVGAAVLDNADIWPGHSSHEQRGGNVNNGHDSPSGELARVFSTRVEACADLQRRHPEPLGLKTAIADSDHLGSVLVGSRKDVRMVGVSTCNGLHVVVIGVKERETEVPARGPRGTPVIAFIQGGFSATT